MVGRLQNEAKGHHGDHEKEWTRGGYNHPVQWEIPNMASVNPVTGRHHPRFEWGWGKGVRKLTQ